MANLFEDLPALVNHEGQAQPVADGAVRAAEIVTGKVLSGRR
jgi:hypothetical protein